MADKHIHGANIVRWRRDISGKRNAADTDDFDMASLEAAEELLSIFCKGGRL